MERSTPNLPSRDFDETSRFYARIGFEVAFRNEGWMILKRGDLVVEFFPHPHLKPLESWFSCCFRLDDVEAFFKVCKNAGIPEKSKGVPRLHAPADTGEIFMGALLDPDGSLIRFIAN